MKVIHVKLRTGKWVVLGAAMAISAATAGLVLWGNGQRGSAAPGPEGFVQFAPAASAPAGATSLASAFAPVRTLAAVDARYSATPRKLTAKECEEARPMMEGIAQNMGPQIKAMEGDHSIDAVRFDNAVQASRAWFATGCPLDAKLGYYDAVDGSGGIKAILIDYNN